MRFLLIIGLFLFQSLIPLNSAVAAPVSCGGGISYNITDPAPPIPANTGSVSIQFTSQSGWPTGGTYKLTFPPSVTYLQVINHWVEAAHVAGNPNILQVDITGNEVWDGTHQGWFEYQPAGGGNWQTFCSNVVYKVGFNLNDCAMSYRPQDSTHPTQVDNIEISVRSAPPGNYPIIGPAGDTLTNVRVDNSGSGTANIGTLPFGNQTIRLRSGGGERPIGLCSTVVNVKFNGSATPVPLLTVTPTLVPGAPTPTLVPGAPTPTFAPSSRCVDTALGCVDVEINRFVPQILKYVVGLAGGVAFLLMIFGAFEMMTSGGSPEHLKAGQERFTSAAIGLLFIIFSVFLLKVIGADILGIGGFF